MWARGSNAQDQCLQITCKNLLKTREIVLQLLQSQSHLGQTSHPSVTHIDRLPLTPHTITIIFSVQKGPLQGSSIVFCVVTVMLQKLVLANFDTEGTTNRSPCNTMHRSPVAHGIGAHCTHFWSVGPGVQHARPMSSNNLQELAKTREVVLQLLQS